MPQACFLANWKMHKTISEARGYLSTLEKGLRELPPDGWEAIVAPPFTALAAVSDSLKEAGLSFRIGLAAQNVHFEEKGAHTGEVSAPMLKDVGCRYVIIGHSERRNEFGETDLLIGRKIKAAFRAGLAPILCVGEKQDERIAGKTLSVIRHQLESALKESAKIESAGASRELMVAYEPVWAIGTGETPSPSEAEAVHLEIRNYLETELKERGKRTRILYGGSVTAQNIGLFMKEADIDGVLVGGASLSADTFSKIIESGVAAKGIGVRK